MATTQNIQLFHKSPVVAKIAVSYSAEAMADFDIDAVDKFPPDATVTFDLHIDDEDGTKIIDALELDYETASDGEYIGTESPDTQIEKGQRYFWSIKVISVSAITQHFNGFETAVYNPGN